MNTEAAITSLAALAHKTRLEIFRQLVQAGPHGLSVGEIAAQTGVAGATLNHHLAQLNRAGLLQSRQEGRYVFHATDFQAINDLIGFLLENCCGGQHACCSMPTADCGEAGTCKK